MAQRISDGFFCHLVSQVYSVLLHSVFLHLNSSRPTAKQGMTEADMVIFVDYFKAGRFDAGDHLIASIHTAVAVGDGCTKSNALSE
jgi:hypothetical protein